MDHKITLLLLGVMFLFWQLLIWKKIKLKKWQDYTLSVIMVLLVGRLIYLTFLR